MITKHQRANAERMVLLSRELGDLEYNRFGQTPNQVLNLSLPCAALVVAGIVTGVEDTTDGINDNALYDVEQTIAHAVEYTTSIHGTGWWNDKAKELGL